MHHCINHRQFAVSACLFYCYFNQSIWHCTNAPKIAIFIIKQEKEHAHGWIVSISCPISCRHLHQKRSFCHCDLPFATIVSSTTLQFLKHHIAIQKHRGNTSHLATRLLHHNEWRGSLLVSTNSYFIELILSIEIPYLPLMLQQLPVGLNATSFVNALNKGGCITECFYGDFAVEQCCSSCILIRGHLTTG